MQPLIFRFRLRPEHSIGREELVRLWAKACRSSRVSVSRAEAVLGHHEKGYIYSLQADATADSPDIRERITAALTEALPEAPIVIANQSSA
jgi:hypothetical protein